MKVKWPLLICGVLVALTVFFWTWFSRPASTAKMMPVSIYFHGYTNLSGTNMAVFQITNRTATLFCCFVGPRFSEANPLVHDLSNAAPPGFMRPYGSFGFVVPASPDSNQWHVTVEVRQLREGLPPQLASFLRRFHNQQYLLTSPAFSCPSP